MRRAWTQAGWIARCTANLPDGVVRELRAGHAQRIGQKDPASTSPVYCANIWIGQRYNQLRAARVTIAYDEEAIRAHADNYARICCKMRPSNPDDNAAQLRAVAHRIQFADSIGIEISGNKDTRLFGIVARLEDPLWWRRQLRKIWTREAENGMRNLGIIRKDKEPYASDTAVEHRRLRKHRMRDWIEASEAVNEDKETIDLATLVDGSIANPEIRRGEMMTRARGFEEIAEKFKHKADFWTLTAPSAFHAQLSHGGANPQFGKSQTGERAEPNVREAQSWLVKMWARVRAQIKREKLTVYGFRVAEAHHDATPHWHLLLFGNSAALESVRRIMSRVWLSEYANEPGAREHRTHVKRIDPEQGSATGYIAKYIAKNIDGAGVIGASEDLETGGDVNANLIRVEAWAATHGIRQFQQIGGPPVGLWRECRRIRDEVEDIDIERARRAADAGDWGGFVQRVGGIHAGRHTNITLRKEDTGEVNKYGELRPPRVVGVQCASALTLTRLQRWRLKKKDRSGSYSELGPVAITVRAPPGLNEPMAWTNPQETSQAPP
jgi:hypothetical protein